ncbi:MAG: hypothetical protein K0U36_03725 [Alphaproteobacteria bacterium]|nr:hypothetical protein [Alphaproteobacteria bacterium]
MKLFLKTKQEEEKQTSRAKNPTPPTPPTPPYPPPLPHQQGEESCGTDSTNRGIMTTTSAKEQGAMVTNAKT